MPHSYSPIYRQAADPTRLEARPDAPLALRRERVPTLIDALDCLLALWVAEATLDTGPSHGEREDRRLGRNGD